VIAAAILALLLAGVAAYAALVLMGLRKRNVGIWWHDYRRHQAERARLAPAAGPKHVMFCFVDHYEPRWGKADYATEVERVRLWTEQYPKLCEGHRDADGRAPQHSFFFPSEEYRPEHLDKLVDLCRAGYGEIEVHLHHDDDTEAGLRANLDEFLEILVGRHDALPLDAATGKPLWSFIHGNWALDNSRCDGRWCGVNNELQILRDMGCYADFTLPSAPSDTQTSTVNSIYYATDDPAKPKSHDTGERVRVGGKPAGDLMIMQGPLCLRWKMRGPLPVPSIENGDVRAGNPPTPARVDAWVETGVHVQGRPEWVFVKVHTHGTQERDIAALLGEPVARMFEHLERRYNDGRDHVLHYVSAREMYNIARAAEAGKAGDPGQYRDFVIPRPGYARRAAA
jgi:hypothetical protein